MPNAAAGSLPSLFLATLALASSSAPAAAAVAHVRLDDVARGSLLLPTDEPGTFRELPTLDTRLDVHVSGLLVRAEVTQRFQTTEAAEAEALYAFPLPDGAAVDRLRVKIGERVIEGVIKEREEARQIFEQAKREGKKASLVEQHRPNLFTNALANLPPGVVVEVTIGYQEVLPYDDGRVRFSFPTAITPRYTPPFAVGRLATVPAGTAGFAGPLGAGRIDAQVTVDAGFPAQAVTSPSHPLDVKRHGDERFAVTVRGAADRDVVVEWRARPSAEPRARLLYESFGGEQYALLLVTPPRAADVETRPVPREVVFVIDSSGSMHGESLEQAQQALVLAIERLGEADRFNVVDFDSSARALFEAPVPATSASREEAARFVHALTADGGTEMYGALQLAFAQKTEAFAGVRQIVFITDGAVSNEAALFDAIRARLEDRRLFTVGIGRAPNGHFMRKAAELGRGTFTYVASLPEVREKMSALFTKLERPALTDIAVDFGVPVEMYPAKVPDLYAGEPVLVVARAKELGARVRVTGARGAARFEAEVALAGGDARGALHKLWAHRKVEALVDGGPTPRGAPYGGDAARAEIVATALRHGIVTSFTSLVAVEEPALASLSAPPVGSLPQGGTPALLLLLVGGGLLSAGAYGARRRRPS